VQFGLIDKNKLGRSKAMMSPVHQDQDCKMCGGRMSFSCGEETEPGFEIQTFECQRCHSVGQLMAAVPARLKAGELAA
jgi:hypothetical protein